MGTARAAGQACTAALTCPVQLVKRTRWLRPCFMQSTPPALMPCPASACYVSTSVSRCELEAHQRRGVLCSCSRLAKLPVPWGRQQLSQQSRDLRRATYLLLCTLRRPQRVLPYSVCALKNCLPRAAAQSALSQKQKSVARVGWVMGAAGYLAPRRCVCHPARWCHTVCDQPETRDHLLAAAELTPAGGGTQWVLDRRKDSYRAAALRLLVAFARQAALLCRRGQLRTPQYTHSCPR